MNHQSIHLISETVELIPLTVSHSEALYKSGLHPDTWQWLPRDPFSSVEDAKNWILEGISKDNEFPFAIVYKESNTIIGSTRYMDIRPKDKALEIGWTWLHPDYWRTAVNSECKLLLLQHAFETQHYNRVQFRTDSRNTRSQNAIERLGAKKDGVMRSDKLLPDGYRRDSVFYSILIEEWETLKPRLQKFTPVA